MRKIITLLSGIVAIVIAIAVAIWARNNYMSSVTLMQIPVPKADIAPYTMLRPDLFVMAEFPSALKEKGTAFAMSMEDLNGRITTTRLAANVPVPASLVALPKNFRLADPSLQVLSIPVSPEIAVGGTLRIGEEINLFRIAVKTDTTDIPTPSTTVGIPSDQIGKIQNLSDLESVKVELIATVPLIDIQTGSGSSTGAESKTDKSTALVGSGTQQEEPKPAAILIVAVNNEQAVQIMRLLGTTRKGGEMMWVTLARADGESNFTEQVKK